MTRSSILRPFATAWRARAYFFLMVVFWILYNILPPILSDVFPSPRSWWQDFLVKGVGSFDKFAYFSAVAGLVYVVLSDVVDYIWSSSLQSEVRKGFSETGLILTNSLTNFTSGLVGMTFESVKVWIEGGRGNEQQIRAVAETALVNVYGRHNVNRDGLVGFLMDGFLDKWALEAAQTWEQFSSVVVLRKSDIHNYFQWEETRHYTLVCVSRSGTLPVRLEGSWQIRPSELGTALKGMEFKVHFGSTMIADFSSWWKQNQSGFSSSIFKIERDNFLLEYDGVWLAFQFTADCIISAERTDVNIYERTYISTEDRCYALTLRHPTKGIRISLSIEGAPEWIVKPPVVSADFYKRHGRIVQIDKPHKHSCQWNTQEWALPGIAMVIEWSPD